MPCGRRYEYRDPVIPLKVSRDILSRVLVPNILHEIIIHSVPPWLDDWHDSWSIRNETLYNLLRVNKLFYAVATPLLYGTLKQAFPDHSARWWLKLRGGEQWSGHPFLNQGTKPELLAYTTTLKIGEHPARQCAFVKGSDGEDWIDNLDATALSLPNLHHLIVGGGAQNGCNGLVCPLTINMAPKPPAWARGPHAHHLIVTLPVTSVAQFAHAVGQLGEKTEYLEMSYRPAPMEEMRVKKKRGQSFINFMQTTDPHDTIASPQHQKELDDFRDIVCPEIANALKTRANLSVKIILNQYIRKHADGAMQEKFQAVWDEHADVCDEDKDRLQIVEFTDGL